MSSPLVTGGSFALKSNLNGKYLRYSPEKGKILEVTGEDVLSPYTRFHAEPSKKHDGHVHIRCCYNNKYWVAREVNQELCLMGDSNEPQEDLSDHSCTLLQHESDHIDNVNLRHAGLKRSVYMLADAHPAEKTLRSGSLLLGNNDKPGGDAHKFSVINLQGHMFSVDDIGDPTVRNVIHTNSDGTIRIYSSHYGKYWRGSPTWIWGDSDDTTSKNRATVFQPVLLGDGAKCALKNLGNNKFCKRLTYEGKVDCLNAGVTTISKYAQMELHEAVLSRRIYGIEYRLDDVNIHDQKPRTFYSKTIVNKTSRPYKSKLTIAYNVTTQTKWDSNVSLKVGVKTTITAGIPEIAQASVEISSEFSGSYTWGESLSETEQHSNEEEVEVPPNSEITVRVVATEGNCDIPFSYYQEDLLTTGERVVTKMDDGIYTGVNSYGFKTEITE
ncbi:hypothetical protein QOZ80_8BG0660120 [Eleusine coracana subsp. coracana]|uniref:Agglutinin domain-containing protein n=1 Tax=Eleusine coracana subsp. coracana TaxID=191504 RepID=A0AAV9FYA7_ELECO|nr:hypothetical protein QOZ80_UnG0724580 [Eleusine coracana subsp. coracana]KAK3121739.1 hypothetical protein QOZ80_8BG0660120 [Eleusine coracana subsp. coracana]